MIVPTDDSGMSPSQSTAEKPPVGMQGRESKEGAARPSDVLVEF